MRLDAVSAVVLLVCLLSAMLSLSFLMQVQADSTTIYVDAGNVNDPSQDGSASHPFDSIQKGVDAADSGDTVQVAPGVYYQGVEITKSFFSLVGQEGSTIVDGNGTGLVGIRIFHGAPDYTENVSISGFVVRNFVKGITLSRSIYVRLRDNTMVNNTYNFGDYTLQVHDIDASNTVGGRPIYFWVDQHDRQVPANAGFVDLVNCVNITVKDLNLTNNVQGLVLKNTTNSVVENNRITNDWDGFYLEIQSGNNTLVNNTVSNNNAHYGMGIYVSTSSGNIIQDNWILDNAYGLFLDSTVYEVVIGQPSTGNTVTGNVVTGNTVANNSLVGVYSLQAEANVFYGNNFVNNTQQVYSVNSTNLWDDGSRGNYWSDYQAKYPNATETGSSGIWDTPYFIDTSDVDNYPLTYPAAIPEFPSPVILSVCLLACFTIIMTHRIRRLHTGTLTSFSPPPCEQQKRLVIERYPNSASGKRTPRSTFLCLSTNC
jgi:parallel beta-helix repeat protein